MKRDIAIGWISGMVWALWTGLFAYIAASPLDWSLSLVLAALAVGVMHRSNNVAQSAPIRSDRCAGAAVEGGPKTAVPSWGEHRSQVCAVTLAAIFFYTILHLDSVAIPRGLFLAGHPAGTLFLLTMASEAAVGYGLYRGLVGTFKMGTGDFLAVD